MNFIEIVESVDKIENKLAGLNDGQLNLIEKMIVEGADIEFDVSHYMDYIVEYVKQYNDIDAELIAESVDCGEVLDAILESARKKSDVSEAITEAKKITDELDVIFEATEKVELPFLSIVTSALTDILGESEVENLPAEMVFDIVESTKELDIPDEIINQDVDVMIESIKNTIKDAIENGEIDFDTEDYNSETLSEFLNDYEDMDDLLTEMTEVTEEILSEATDEDGANLLRKAKEATVILEAKRTRCSTKTCMIKKGKAAKAYYSKNKMHDGTDVKKIKVDKLSGKLAKYVKKAKMAAKARKKEMDDNYVQYVLIPGILKRMRYKNKKMKKTDLKKKPGMK